MGRAGLAPALELPPEPECCAGPRESILAGSLPQDQRRGGKPLPAAPIPVCSCFFLVLDKPQGWTNPSCCSQPWEHHSMANGPCRIHSLLPWGNSSFMQGHKAQTPSLSCSPALRKGEKTDPGFGPGSAWCQQRTAGSTNNLQGFILGEEGKAAKGEAQEIQMPWPKSLGEPWIANNAGWQ